VLRRPWSADVWSADGAGQSTCRCLSEMAELTATAAVVAKAMMATTTAPVGFE
jgi:hypothetical protein